MTFYLILRNITMNFIPFRIIPGITVVLILYSTYGILYILCTRTQESSLFVFLNPYIVIDVVIQSII